MESLPTELLLEITDQLDGSTVSKLARCSRLLHQRVNPLVYRRDVKTGDPNAPFWGAENNLVGTLRHARASGASLHRARFASMPWYEIWDRYPRNRGRQQLRKLRRENRGAQGKALTAEELERRDEDRVRAEFARAEAGGASGSSSTTANDHHHNNGNYIAEFGARQHCQPRERTWKTADPRTFFWWHPLDLAAAMGHTDAVRYLVGVVGAEAAMGSTSRGVCRSLGMCKSRGRRRNLDGPPGRGAAGFGWMIHFAAELAGCAEHVETYREIYRAAHQGSAPDHRFLRLGWEGEGERRDGFAEVKGGGAAVGRQRAARKQRKYYEADHSGRYERRRDREKREEGNQPSAKLDLRGGLSLATRNLRRLGSSFCFIEAGPQA